MGRTRVAPAGLLGSPCISPGWAVKKKHRSGLVKPRLSDRDGSINSTGKTGWLELGLDVKDRLRE